MAQTVLDIASIRSALSGRLVGGRVLHYDLLGSTMDEARRLAEEAAPEGTVVVAEEQTAGRGRFDRVWISPRGENLSFSVLLRPKLGQLPYLNMAATLAVCRTAAVVGDLSPTVKWPNDVLVNGKKISGVLIEAAVDAREVGHAVVGIGVNVGFDPSAFAEIASTATSLSREAGRTVERTEVLEFLLTELDELYGAVRRGESLTKDWSAKLETLGRDVQIRWGEHLLEGRADAVDEQGNLVLARSDGSMLTVVAGEVTLQT